ncbi:MAG: GAF domain-containing protein [Anaerolineales bacterium]|nr:GAF domain-containing protein [Anaerolineales bacterium]
MLPPASRFMLLFATVISLLGQGFWLAPDRFEFILKYLSAVGNIIPGGVFLTLAWLLYIQSLRRIRLSQERIKRQTETLLFIQFIAAVGTLLLLKDLPAETKQTGFLLSGAITLLTSIGLYLNFSIPGREDKSGEGSGSFDLIAEGKETDALRAQIESLNERLAGEKRRNTQLTFLNELSKQLEAELELEVAAQLAVNTLAHAIDSSFASLLWHEPENKRYVMLTAAGKDIGTIPPGYQQDSTRGVLGRTTRLKKTQIVHDTRADADFLPVDSFTVRSMISVPILQHSKIRSVIEICSDKVSAFSSGDISIAEDVALELTRSWERVSYHQRLKELIQAGISLTTLLDPQAAVQEVALIAQRTLEARFVFVTLLDQQGNFSRMAAAGDAPRLFASLSQNSTNEPIIQAALNAARPFRIRDIRKYAQPGKMDADTTSLRSALAIPIRLHRLSIGTIIAFGKQDGVSFSENDESLADLMSSQAAASIESSWLYQELRNTLNTTSMLYQLSVNVIQAEELSDAAELIAQAAHKLTSASETGITLLSKSGNIEAEVGIDVNGFHNRREHPQTSINQAIQTGQSIIISNENGSIVCYPLLTMSGTYGALWMNIPESRGQNFANLQTLANQAAIALERAILLAESRRQAEEIKRAYAELETTYDRTLTSLMSALDARDRETEGHSVRVSRLACTLAKKLGLSEAQLKSLERGALLHDIGKIGISDTILHKPEKLTDDEWKIMRVHPDIGARIVEGIPFLNDAVPLIRHHHERWDGSGYPAGLRGKEIPTQARIFAVADVFDALTSRRRYREKSTPDEALQFMKENAGVLFDPDIIDTLTRISHHEFIESANAQ